MITGPWKRKQTVPTVADLAAAYRVLQARRADLDRRITSLPPDDVEGRDMLMADLEPVLTEQHDTLRQLSRARAHDVAALRSKAAVIIGVEPADDPDVLMALARSLAYDVAEVLGST
jgi:hypothetical protein